MKGEEIKKGLITTLNKPGTQWEVIGSNIVNYSFNFKYGTHFKKLLENLFG